MRVGRDAIRQATVEHWARVIKRGGTLSGLRRSDQGTARERAVELLISFKWLVDEAERLRLPVSSRSAEAALIERRATNGGAEFEEGLHATGQTIADVKLEIHAELALAAISRSLVKRAARVGEGEIGDFYERNRGMFVVPEARYVDLIETLPSRAAAVALIKRLGSGPRFAKKAFHETIPRGFAVGLRSLEKAAIVHAIFAARQGVVGAPMRLNRRWTVFVVRGTRPARLRPLAQVRREIVRRLVARRRTRITARFDREYKARWTAQTSCRAGYVVRGCTQYPGPTVTEENVFSGT